MTQEHAQTAKLLASLYRADRALVSVLIMGIADIFAASDPQFDRVEFEAACQPVELQ